MLVIISAVGHVPAERGCRLISLIQNFSFLSPPSHACSPGAILTVHHPSAD